MSALPPGPKGSALSQTLRFSGDPYGFLKSAPLEIGDPFTFTMLGEGAMVLFSQHEHIRQIFALPRKDLRSANETVRFLLDERSIVFLEGEEHRHARKVMSTPFSGRTLEGYARSIHAATVHELSGFADDALVPLHAAFQHVTFDALLEAIVGVEEAGRFAELRGHLLSYVDGALTPAMFAAAITVGPWLQRHTAKAVAAKSATLRAGGSPSAWGPLGSRTSTLARCAVLLHELVRERRESGAQGASVLDRFLQRPGPDGEPVPDHDIVQELLTLFVAGHDTTSIGLTWAMVALLDHPEVVARVREEVAPFMEPEPDLAGLARCAYLDAVVSESLRFYPPSPLVPRRAVVDVTIGGVELPAGTRFGPNIIGAHFSEEAWGDPHVFRPERFLDEHPSSAFVPFGGGHRKCLGAAFTRFEMRIVLARLLTDFDVTPGPKHSRDASVHGILIGTKKPLKARVRRRT